MYEINDKDKIIESSTSIVGQNLPKWDRISGQRNGMRLQKEVGSDKWQKTSLVACWMIKATQGIKWHSLSRP